MARGVRFIGYVTVRQPEHDAGRTDGVQETLTPGRAAGQISPGPAYSEPGTENSGLEQSQADAQPPAHLPIALSARWWIVQQMDRNEDTRRALPADGAHLSRLDAIQQESTRARAVLAEAGRTHRYAATTLASTLAIAQTLVPPDDNVLHEAPVFAIAMSRLSREYTHAMLAVVDGAGNQILETIAQRHSLEICGAQPRHRIDQASDEYLRRVRTLLHGKENSHGEERTEPVGVGTADPVW